MPRTNRNQAFDLAGNLISEELVTVSDAEIDREQAPTRIRAFHATLREWAADAENLDANWLTRTVIQKDAAQRVTYRRLAAFFRAFAALIEHEGLDR